MGDILKFTGVTCVEEPPEQVLEKAKEWGLKYVIVIGAKEDGCLTWGMSFSDVQMMNLMLDATKHELLRKWFRAEGE